MSRSSISRSPIPPLPVAPAGSEAATCRPAVNYIANPSAQDLGRKVGSDLV